MRLNNIRQALLLFLFLLSLFFLLLLPYFSPPSTSSCPQPQFSAGFILQPTLFVYLFLHSPICLTFSSRMHIISQLPRGPLGLSFHSPEVFNLTFDYSFLQACTLYGSLSSFTVFILLFFAVIICCQVRLPVFVTHICKSLFKDNTLLFIIFLCMCDYEQYIVRASVSQSVSWRKHSSDGRLKGMCNAFRKN